MSELEKAPAPEKPPGPEKLPALAQDGLPAQDTSWEAYTVLFGATLSLTMSFGALNAYGVYEDIYATMYPDESASLLGLIGGVQTGALFFAGLFVGRLYDQYGPQPIMLAGSFLCTFGLMMLSLTNAVWQIFLTQGVIFGVGTGCIFITAIALIPSWFVRRRAFAMGICTSGGALGGLFWPPAIKLLTQEISLAWANRIMGFIALAVLLASTALCKPRTPPNPATARSLIPAFHLLRRPAFATIWVSALLGYLGLFGIIFFISARGTAVGMDSTLAIYMVIVLNAGSLLGRTVPPFIADKVGPINIFVAATALNVVIVAAAWVPANTQAGVIVTAILYGFSSGAWISVVAPCVPRLAGGIQNIGASIGMLYVASVPGSLAGPSIGSSVIGAGMEAAGFEKAGAIWAAFFLGCLVFGIITKLLVDRNPLAKV